jgi:hypothetical protein
MTDQEKQTPLPAQETSEAIVVQPDQQDKNALALQQIRQALLDHLDAQGNAIEELSDEQLAAIGGGIGELPGKLVRSLSDSALITRPEPPLRRAFSLSEHELQIERLQPHTPHQITPPASPDADSPRGPFETNKRRKLG